MTYSSIVTSKGTITLPASIRDKLGITPGKQVSIELHGDTITVKPKGGWEEVLAVGAKMRADLQKRGMSLPVDDDKLRRQVEKSKTAYYHQKYLSGAETNAASKS